MTFEEILDQAIAMLQRRGRLTYGALKRQFHLDDGEQGDAGGYAATGISSASRSMSGYQRLKMAPSSPLSVRTRVCNNKCQIPSDLVVKSQSTDIIDLILQLIGHSNGVHRACHHRKSRGAMLSTSEVQ